MSPKVIENAVILERNPNGNYRVVELASQEIILLPKPTILFQSHSLESFSLLYQLIGQTVMEGASAPWLVSPAYLYQIIRHKRWALKTKGELRCGKSALFRLALTARLHPIKL